MLKMIKLNVHLYSGPRIFILLMNQQAGWERVSRNPFQDTKMYLGIFLVKDLWAPRPPLYKNVHTSWNVRPTKVKHSTYKS